jgi:hypothetical protein
LAASKYAHGASVPMDVLVSVGTRLLEQAFAPMEKLEGRCAVFRSAFVIATARLATHEELRRRPVYWRRLAAAAHASLVVRTLGIEGADHRKLLEWAIKVAGGVSSSRAGLIAKSSHAGGRSGSQTAI